MGYLYLSCGGWLARALDVLDLLLTFQFNTRLESFIAKFKTAEVSATSKKSKLRSILVPLLYDNFDPFDTAKSVAAVAVGGVAQWLAAFGVNAVNARRARLVLGWVTVFGRVFHLGM